MNGRIITMLIASALAFNVSAKRNHGHNSPPSPPPLAPTRVQASAPSLNDEAFSRIVKLIKKQSFDDGKLQMVEAISMLGLFSAHQCADILKTFSFDDNRLKALKYLSPTITDPWQQYEIVREFTFDSNKRKAIEILRRR